MRECVLAHIPRCAGRFGKAEAAAAYFARFLQRRMFRLLGFAQDARARWRI
jgi:hypothetical protein